MGPSTSEETVFWTTANGNKKSCLFAKTVASLHFSRRSGNVADFRESQKVAKQTWCGTRTVPCNLLKADPNQKGLLNSWTSSDTSYSACLIYEWQGFLQFVIMPMFKESQPWCSLAFSVSRDTDVNSVWTAEARNSFCARGQLEPQKPNIQIWETLFLIASCSWQ